MRTWITSDLHLFHENIIAYCGRPHETVDQMNQKIISAWNEVVASDDRVIVVGDLSAGLGPRKEALQKIIGDLPGRKTLIRGNHDHQADMWYICAGFESVADWTFEDGMLFIHKPAPSMNPESVRVFEQMSPDIVVHGHIHSRDRTIPGHFNVAWDRFYRLVDLEEVKSANRAHRNVV